MSREIPNEFYLFVGGSANGRKICTGGQTVWQVRVQSKTTDVSDFSLRESVILTSVIRTEMYEAVPFRAGDIKTEIFVPMDTQGDKGEFALLALINDYARRREPR